MRFHGIAAALALTACTPAIAYAQTTTSWDNMAAMQQSSGKDCSDAVQQQVKTLQVAQIDGATAVAKQVYDVLPQGSFSQLSCLDNIMGSGLNVVFEPPSLESIKNWVQGQVCTAANNLVTQATQPLYQTLSTSVPGANIIPGLNLGNFNTGLSVSPTFGNTNGSLVTTNVNSVFSRSLGSNQTTFSGLFEKVTK